MEDNILGFPGYHITREGKLYNKGHPVKTFFHKGYERTKLRNNRVSKNVKIHRLVAVTVRSIRRLERLKLKGNTNKYIAKRLKVSNATVGNYLNGKHYKS